MGDKEELFFDGKTYYTREEFFADDEDYEQPGIQTRRKKLKVIIASVLAIVLLTNVLAFWPQVYNIAAIKFLIKSRELSKDEAIQQYKESVVVVATDDGKGTGFVVSADGMIITNHHVIDGHSTVLVNFHGGGTTEAVVVAQDPEIDIAVLRVERDQNAKLTVLDMNRKSEWKVDRAVYVIGNPLFFNYIANEGHVIGYTELVGWDIPVLAIDAPIYKGNSGSPVINEEGEVIGIVFATTKLKHNGKNKKVGLAVPIDYVLPFVE